MDKKCLIIDDVEVSRYVLSVHMMELGFEVIEAEDADVALELLKSHNVDVAIIDWHLRHESGLNLIPKLRKIRGFEKMPIFISSGVAQGEVAETVKEAGAQAFLMKPVSREQLEIELKNIGFN